MAEFAELSSLYIRCTWFCQHISWHRFDFLAICTCMSAMSWAAHMLASKAWVVEQSLSLSNLGTGHNRIQRRKTNWNTFFLRKTVLPCFAAVFSEQHETPFFFNHSLFYNFLSDHDINRQVDEETIVSWTMASCGLWHSHARVIVINHKVY